MKIKQGLMPDTRPLAARGAIHLLQTGGGHPACSPSRRKAAQHV
jgi:hypothetical protein